APRRARLVVVVADRHGHGEAVERDAVVFPGLDHPREHAQALAVGRAAAGDAVDPPAGADRLAVAGLEVGAGDPPAHGGLAGATPIRTPIRRIRSIGTARAAGAAPSRQAATSVGRRNVTAPAFRGAARGVNVRFNAYRGPEGSPPM